jgi:hypothetical protein
VWEQHGERKTKSIHRKKNGDHGSLEEFAYFVHGDVRAFETPNPRIQKVLRLSSSVRWVAIKRRNVNTGWPVPTLSTSLTIPQRT